MKIKDLTLPVVAAVGSVAGIFSDVVKPLSNAFSQSQIAYLILFLIFISVGFLILYVALSKKQKVESVLLRCSKYLILIPMVFSFILLISVILPNFTESYKSPMKEGTSTVSQDYDIQIKLMEKKIQLEQEKQKTLEKEIDLEKQKTSSSSEAVF